MIAGVAFIRFLSPVMASKSDAIHGIGYINIMSDSNFANPVRIFQARILGGSPVRVFASPSPVFLQSGFSGPHFRQQSSPGYR